MEYAGSILSVVGLVAAFIAFCLVRDMARNDHLRAHTNLVIALLFVHVIQVGLFMPSDANIFESEKSILSLCYSKKRQNLPVTE